MIYTEYPTYTDNIICKKQNFAMKHATEDCKVLDEVLFQIEVCEDLKVGLSETQILDLLKLTTELQVENACRRIKMA